MKCFALVAVISAACGNPGLPAYDTSRPPPLKPVGPARDAATVRIAMKPLPWWTVAGGRDAFVLGIDTRASNAAPAGTRIGAVRSRDVELADHVFAAVRCAWLTVPMGESRPCTQTSRTEAMAIARDAITEARAELRAHAADAGAEAVANVRCFAERDVARSRLWCEGVAVSAPSSTRPSERIARARPDASPPEVTEPDPAAPVGHEPALTETRFVLVADASVGMLGRRSIVGSTLGLRFRPLEVGFYILDLQRESLAPRDDGVMGIGVTTLGRIALGNTRADAIIGGSAALASRNNTTNPHFERLYHGFGGIAYQTPWRIAGAAQPFVQLRAGAAYGGVTASRVLPMLELHVGLTSPERR